MADWTTLFGSQLKTKEGTKATADVLGGKKIVGIYFSAHWCPPCRQFTPILATLYEDMLEDHEAEFDIVFVSSDRDEQGFNGYYESMPWKALPFVSRDEKARLAQMYGVQGIPMLVFLNENGQVITADGRSVIMNCRGNADQIWSALTK